MSALTASWPPALLDACGADAYAEEPAALDASHGPCAFRFRLEGDVPLVARLSADRGALEREAAAMRVSRAHGGGAPAVRTLVAVDSGDRSEASWALVSDAASGVLLPELIGWNMRHSDALLRGFGAQHSAIHQIPVAELGDRPVVPLVSAAAELARIDATRFPAEWRWLQEHLPTAGEVALCHGGYHPWCVYGPPREQWAEHGGPGMGLTVLNWSGAVLAEPAFDVAHTLVAFWSAPYFAGSRGERAQIKMIRNSMLNTYTLGYTGYRALDPARLRFWRAFHALRGRARIDGAYDSAGSPFEPQDRGSLPCDLGPALERHFWHVTRSR